MNFMYCPCCQQAQPITYKTVQLQGEYFKTKCSATGKKIFCKVCTKEILSDELIKQNEINLREAYKKEKGLITNEEILYILKTYKITRVGISLLLEWGHVTLQRYLGNTAFPKKPFSDQLYELRDPSIMKELLIKNGSRLKNNTYAICNHAVDTLLSQNVNDIFKDVIQINSIDTQSVKQLSLTPSSPLSMSITEEVYEETPDTVYQKMIQLDPPLVEEQPQEKSKRYPDFRRLKTFIDVTDAKIIEHILSRAFKIAGEPLDGLASYKHLQWHPLTAATLLIAPLYFNGYIPSLSYFDKDLSVYRVLLTPPQKNPVSKETVKGYVNFLREKVLPYYEDIERVIYHKDESEK